jgi:hypothetical protein
MDLASAPPSTAPCGMLFRGHFASDRYAAAARLTQREARLTRSARFFRGTTVATAGLEETMMWQRSAICSPRPTRRHQGGIVLVRPMLTLMVFFLVLAASPLIAGSDTPMPRNYVVASASADTRAAGPSRREQACFPVSVEVWATPRFEDSDSYIAGWASIDRTAHFDGRGCQVRGWASIDPCGRTITAYLANCPDGAFTFTKTEADCYEVLGCRDRHDGAGSGPPGEDARPGSAFTTTSSGRRRGCERIGRPSASRASTTVLRSANCTSTDPGSTSPDGRNVGEPHPASR